MQRDTDSVRDDLRTFVSVINDNTAARRTAEQVSTAIQFAAGGADFYLTIADGAARFRDGRHPKPDVTVSASPSVLHDVIYGPRSITHFIRDGDLKVASGDEHYLDLIDLDRIITACGADLASAGGDDE